MRWIITALILIQAALCFGQDILLKKKNSRFTAIAGGIVNDPVYTNVINVWHLEEGAGTNRADANGGLTLFETSGTIPNNVTGEHNLCSEVSTTATLDTHANVHLSFPFTFICWVKVAAGKGVHWQFGINGCTVGGNGSYSFRAANSGAAMTDISHVPLSTAIWHMCTLTADGSVQTLYIDGTSRDSGACTVADADTVLSVSGAGVSGAVIDELSWYTNSLSSTQISNMWNNAVWFSP